MVKHRHSWKRLVKKVEGKSDLHLGRECTGCRKKHIIPELRA